MARVLKKILSIQDLKVAFVGETEDVVAVKVSFDINQGEIVGGGVWMWKVDDSSNHFALTPPQ